MLVGWAAGPSAAAYGPQAPIDRWMRTLAATFGQSTGYLQERLVGGHFHDWNADQYARGAYSYSQGVKEVMAALNLANAVEIGVSATLSF